VQGLGPEDPRTKRRTRVSGTVGTVTERVTEPETAIESYLAETPEPARAALAELCRIISSSDERIRGEIKWNAPSFAIDDHFATTGLIKGGGVRLVLHTGAKRTGAKRKPVIDNPEGLLDWKDADRAVTVFADVAEVRRQEDALRVILSEWIAQTQGVLS
jgi:hypothetical protein